MRSLEQRLRMLRAAIRRYSVWPRATKASASCAIRSMPLRTGGTVSFVLGDIVSLVGATISLESGPDRRAASGGQRKEPNACMVSQYTLQRKRPLVRWRGGVL